MCSASQWMMGKPVPAAMFGNVVISGKLYPFAQKYMKVLGCSDEAM